MDDTLQTPEELIADMSADELCELLEELGIEANDNQARGIKELVAQLGSLEMAIDALTLMDDQVGSRRAA